MPLFKDVAKLIPHPFPISPELNPIVLLEKPSEPNSCFNLKNCLEVVDLVIILIVPPTDGIANFDAPKPSDVKKD